MAGLRKRCSQGGSPALSNRSPCCLHCCSLWRLGCRLLPVARPRLAAGRAPSVRSGPLDLVTVGTEAAQGATRGTHISWLSLDSQLLQCAAAAAVSVALIEAMESDSRDLCLFSF